MKKETIVTLVNNELVITHKLSRAKAGKLAKSLVDFVDGLGVLAHELPLAEPVAGKVEAAAEEKKVSA